MNFLNKSIFALFDFESKSHYGEVTSENSSTHLRITGTESIPPLDDGQWLLGVTQDRKRLTCIDCIDLGMSSNWIANHETFHTRTIFPHFTAIGSFHLQKDEKSINKISFRITDGDNYFYDISSFGLIADAETFAKVRLKAEKNYPIQTGSDPLVLYFDGRQELFKCTTEMGEISISRHVIATPGGAKGIRVDSEIHIYVTPEKSTDFKDALKKLNALRSFFSMVIGRYQGISELKLRVAGKSSENSVWLAVQASNADDWATDKEIYSTELNNLDAPINPTRSTDEFSDVLRKWISREESWRTARFRFESCIKKHLYYDIDRLVSAANMFDVMPSSAYPQDLALTSEMQDAVLRCVAILKPLPHSPDREAALGAIKRMGKLSLPKKVRHRAGIVVSVLGNAYEGLERVSKMAIKARNYFVHGSDDFDHAAYENQIAFFTDTLEFIFSASDMIESGWNANSWHERSHMPTNIYSRYKVHYEESLLAFDKISNSALE